MTESDVEDYKTKIQKENGDVTFVKLDINVEGDNARHEMKFKPVEEGKEMVKIVRHRLPTDYREDRGSLGSIDYRTNLTDEALKSVQVARNASEEILEDNGITLVRDDE